jgi:hypothetical protein
LGYGEIVALPVRPGYVIPKMNYMPYPEQLFQEVSSLLYPGGSHPAHQPTGAFVYNKSLAEESSARRYSATGLTIGKM